MNTDNNKDQQSLPVHTGTYFCSLIDSYISPLRYEALLPVYLSAGWAPPGTFAYMPLQDRAGFHVLQAELAQE
jgi:hypothetical protein